MYQLHTYEKQLRFGFKSEADLFNTILEKYNFISTDRYNNFDFIHTGSSKDTYIELKTRTFPIHQYEFTIMPLTKTTRFNELIINKEKQLIFLFGYTNKRETTYYYIIYDKELFDTFKIKEVFGKNHYEIPITMLNKFNETELNALI
jgi:hypothetical protein